MKTQIVSIFVILSLICLSQARWDGKSCGIGQYLNVFQRCVSCPNNCKVCTDGDSCTECYTDYELVSGQHPDLVNTYEFFTTTWTSQVSAQNVYKGCVNKDDILQSGQYIFNKYVYEVYYSTFTGCASMCTSYNAFTFCTSCEDGYFQHGPFCLNCFEDGCKTCSDQFQGSCTECRPGYVLSNLGQCIPCGFACDACELDESRAKSTVTDNIFGIKCTSCRQISGNDWYSGTSSNADLQLQGTQLIGNQCISCPANCEDCSSNILTCDTCQDKYYFDTSVIPGICKACTNHYCHTSDSTFVACIDVGPLRSLLLEGICQTEPLAHAWDNCTAWNTDGSQCTGCTDETVLSSSGACEQTVKYKCLRTSTDSTKCEVCEQGYYFHSVLLLCTWCGVNASGCVKPTGAIAITITSCFMGYYLDNAPSCQKCDGAPNGCVRCDGPDWCTECALGFYYDEQDHTCNACGSDCDKCNSSQICLQCKSSYYNYFGTCKKENYCKYHDPESGVCQGCDLAYGNVAHLKEQVYDKKILNQCFRCGEVIDIQGTYNDDVTFDLSGDYVSGDTIPTTINLGYSTTNREPQWVLVACEPICAADYRESVNAFTLSLSMIALILTLFL